MSEPDARLELLERMLDRNLRWVATADTKIYPIFTIDAAMLGVLATTIRPGVNWSIALAVVSLLAAGALLASIVCLTIASFPRLKKSRSSENSIVYFGGVVSRGEADYFKRVSAGATPELLQDLAHQAYRNAEIAHLKFKAIRWAMILFFSSLLPWLVAVAMHYHSRSLAVIS